MCVFVPTTSGSLSTALLFQYGEGKLSPTIPESGICILKNTAASFAVCLRICFISYLTEAPLCSEHTVPSCEERRREGRGLREHRLFS